MIKFQTNLVSVRLNDEGKLHGNSYPAVEWADGTKEWWQHGKRSRTRKAAILYPNESKESWLNGVRHCYFVPSVIGSYFSELRNEKVILTTGNKKDGYKKLTIHYPQNPILNNTTKKYMFHLDGKEYSWEEWFNHPSRLSHLRKIANYQGVSYNLFVDHWNFRFKKKNHLTFK